MKDSRFIKSIRLRNILSFGPDNAELELMLLNVLIGPNASGKSNFIEAISVLRAAPTDISLPIRKGGGSKEWLWKGEWDTGFLNFETIFSRRPKSKSKDLRYSIDLDLYNDSFTVEMETIDSDEEISEYYYKFVNNKALVKVIKSKVSNLRNREIVELTLEKEFNEHCSIFSQLVDIRSYPEITRLGINLKNIRIYNNWIVGKGNPCRMPQQTDLPSDFLSEDFNNLALVINELESKKEHN